MRRRDGGRSARWVELAQRRVPAGVAVVVIALTWLVVTAVAHGAETPEQRATALAGQMTHLGFPSSAGEPPRQLKAFARVSLRAGRARTARLKLDPSSFEVFDEAANDWKTTPGTYQIYVGASSRNLPLQASVTVP